MHAYRLSRGESCCSDNVCRPCRMIAPNSYTGKLLFRQSPTGHNDYTVVTTVTMYMWSLSSSRSPTLWLLNSDYIRNTRYQVSLPWDLCRNLSIRHLVGNCTVTTWEDTGYLLLTVTVRSQFCSLPLVPLVGERIVTTSSLSSHSTVTT